MLLCLLSGILIATHALAQPARLRLESITIDQGLSQGYVTGIIQDKKGFMWFATGDGLNKYDGYNFTVYHHDPNDATSIGSDDLTCVFEDSQERLWIGTRHNGIDLFDRENGIFTHIRHSNANSLRSNDVMYITGEKEGAIWIRTTEGIDRLEIGNKNSVNKATRFMHVTLDSAFEKTKDKYAPPNVFVDSRNRVFIMATNRVWEVKLSSKISSYNLIERYHFSMNYPMFIATMVEDTVNRYLFLKTQDVIRFAEGNFDSAQRIYSGADMQSPWTIDKNQQLWLPGIHTIVRIGIQSLRIENTALEGPDMIKTVSYSTVFYTDRNGVVWIGTGGYGLLKYDPEKEYFHHILPGNYYYQLVKSSDGSVVTNNFQRLTIKKNQPAVINPLLHPDEKKKFQREPYFLLH